ncbi:hypothetical protein ACFSCX_12235 [Bacillus salitolerans]|uniref:Phr family secreted Rap phosphatase inhibitor n=1 Tax=Bacillus salitolerans TaxID=1437434 RepID=A0ABW4LT94_9BACI
MKKIKFALVIVCLITLGNITNLSYDEQGINQVESVDPIHPPVGSTSF